ncbi:hypothetical protein ES702_01400 [subsurface metagenome]
MPMTYARPELELKLRAPLAGGEPGTREFRRATSVLVGDADTCDFICDGVGDDVEIVAALTYVNALGGGEVLLLEFTYVLVDPIAFPGDNLILRGLGRNSFLDGDGLATTEHAIVLSGVTDCVIRDLAIQTEDGGGKTCHCIFIEDGSDRFTIETVWIIDSDDQGIHIEGTNISAGWIVQVKILGTDGHGIFADMDALNLFLHLQIKLCFITEIGGDGIHLVDVQESQIIGNIICGVSGDGIELGITTSEIIITSNTIWSIVGYSINISNAGAVDNWVLNPNRLDGTGLGCINDLGTDTRLEEVVENVLDSDSFIGDHPSAVLRDGVTNNIRFEFRVPSDFQELVRAYVLVVPRATGNLRRSVTSMWGRWCTQAYNATVGPGIALSTVAGLTADQVECLDISAALVGATANDEVGFTFTRAGGDALDTIDEDVEVLKFVMQYV